MGIPLASVRAVNSVTLLERHVPATCPRSFDGLWQPSARAEPAALSNKLSSLEKCFDFASLSEFLKTSFPKVEKASVSSDAFPTCLPSFSPRADVFPLTQIEGFH